MKRQAEREGGQFLILSPEDSGSAAALSALPSSKPTNEKDAPASSSDIETGPERMRNGTAAPHNTLFEGKGTDNFENSQGHARFSLKERSIHYSNAERAVEGYAAEGWRPEGRRR